MVSRRRSYRKSERRGITASDIFVVIVPYNRQPDFVPESWLEQMRPASLDTLIEAVNKELDDLIESYQGTASRKWDDPHQLDQFGYYLFRPIHSFRMAWYEKHFGTPLGKDPFESWRRWEARIAGALSLKVVSVVLIDIREERLAEGVRLELAKSTLNSVVVRRSNLEADVQNRLLPAIERAVPTKEKAADIRDRKRKLRRVQIRAMATITSYVGTILGGIALIVISLWLLLRIVLDWVL